MKRIGHARRLEPARLVLVIALIWAASAEGVESFGIPAGQDEVLARMLGRGVDLPGACRFAGGGVAGRTVTAEYACDGGRVVFELFHPDAAPADAERTAQFAVAVRSGSAPPGLQAALVARIRAHEQDFAWMRAAGPHPVAPVGAASGAVAIAVLAIAIQYLLVRRQGAVADAPGLFGARGAVPALPMLGLVAMFALMRLTALTRLPVYVDEAIHIHLARLGGADLAPAWSVGKWLPIEIMTLFVSLPCSPLYVARLASVVVGLFALLAGVGIGSRLFSASDGLLAGALYTIIPFALLYDRLALADVYVSAFGAWSVYFAVALISGPRMAWCLGFALAAYAAMLAKPTGALFLCVPFLIVVELVPRGSRAAYLYRTLPAVASAAVLIAYLLWAGYGTGLVTAQSAYDIGGDADRLRGNVALAREWLVPLLTPAVALAALAAASAAVFGAAVGRGRAERFLVALCALLTVPYLLAATIWYPSYMLPAVVPIAVLAARGIAVCAAALSNLGERLLPRGRALWRMAATAILFSPFAIAAAQSDLELIRDPARAGLPAVEQSRYVSGWPSGYGLPELAAFLRDEAIRTPLHVVRYNLAGPINQGLEIYLEPSARLDLHLLDAHDAGAVPDLAAWVQSRRTLMVCEPEREAAAGIDSIWRRGATRVWQINKPDRHSSIEVWELPRS